MKNYALITVLLAVFMFSSCGSEYGKRVKINDNTEVYIKGNDVTEADAHKLGDYIVSKFKDMQQQKSFQLSKDSGQYVVRMVVDQEKLEKDKTLEVSFMAIQMLLEMEAFSGSKVKLVLTDNKFKDFRTFASPAKMAN